MKRSRSAAEEKWRRIIEAQAASGKRAAVYCRERGIGEASFYAWKGRLRRWPREVKFVELKTIGGGTGGMEVVVGGRRVVVRPGFDRNLLAEVIGVLEGME